MKPHNRIKLNALLSELYEDGETTEDITQVITETLTSSDQIELIEDILTGVKDKDQVNDFIERSAVDLIKHGGFYAERIADNIDEKILLKALKDTDTLFDYVEAEKKSETGVLIPAHMVTNDKQSRIQEFIESLFPYYNEQTQIQLNF